MRLIDADDFKKFMQALCKAGSPYESFIELLDKQTTAYDIDKVVKELESELKKGNIAIDFGEFRLFEIVKQCVVSDAVCEWKQTSTARYKTSCGYKEVDKEKYPNAEQKYRFELLESEG